MVSKTNSSIEQASDFPSEKRCECATAMLQRLGGEQAVMHLLLTKPPTAAVAIHHNRVLLKDGSGAIAVNKGLALEGWGVIDVAKRKCHTCPSGRRCMHLSVFPAATTSRLSNREWQEKLGTKFDFESGQRRLTCIMAKRFPLDIQKRNDPIAEQIRGITEGRARGEWTLPAVCPPLGVSPSVRRVQLEAASSWRYGSDL